VRIDVGVRKKCVPNTMSVRGETATRRRKVETVSDSVCNLQNGKEKWGLRIYINKQSGGACTGPSWAGGGKFQQDLGRLPVGFESINWGVVN